MPIYEYVCQDCENAFEVKQGINDPPLTSCSKCEGPVKKIISAPAIMFKGSGWYVTDYSDKLKPPGQEEAGDTAKTEKKEASTEKKEAKETKESPSTTTSSTGEASSAAGTGKSDQASTPKSTSTSSSSTQTSSTTSSSKSSSSSSTS